MDVFRCVIGAACAATLALAGCATSPETKERDLQKQASIAEILAEELDPAEFGETKRCLSDAEFTTYRALDDRHLLFEGRQNRLWVNTLRSSCPDLRHGDILVVRRYGGSRMCDADQFQATDWFDWPGNRRSPDGWGTGIRCVLGKFQPVTQQQVDEIEAVLRSQ
jgi:hypothetical protein